MGSFIIWDMSSRSEGVWRNVEADDARAAAEAVYGGSLRAFGNDSELCMRVRSLDDPDQPVSLFYGTKTGRAARDAESRPGPSGAFRTAAE